VNEKGYTLAVRFGGNAAVVDRYAKEVGGNIVEGAGQQVFWDGVIQYSQRFLQKFPDGAVIRISSTLMQLPEVLKEITATKYAPFLSRAATGVTYAYFNRTDAAIPWMSNAKKYPWRCVMEFSPESKKPGLNLWPAPGDDFGMMKNVKRMFDPRNLLNHGRLYRLI
jgi:hypothetical protein